MALALPDAPPAPARAASRPLLGGIAFGFFVMLLAEVLRVFVGPNFHVVVPHRCYRCGQLTPGGLEDTVRSLGVRTVINLRGVNAEEPWFRDEIRAAERVGVRLVHAGLSAYAPNTAADVRALVAALDRSEEPILLHCHSGSDRSGLAATCYLLLKTDTPPSVAREQLHVRFGHNPWGKAGCHQALLDAYDTWLQGHGVEHAPGHFQRWVNEGLRE